MPPRQKSKIGVNRRAIAPYNFVELPDRVVSAPPPGGHDSYSGHTGVISCTLTTETPLYIRAPLTAQLYAELDGKNWSEMTDEQKHHYARFFHTGDDRPVLPGSSLRGMLRSLVEIGSYGKVDRVTDRGQVQRLVDTSNVGEIYRSRIMRHIDGDELPQRSRNNHYYIPRIRGGYIERVGSDWQIRPAIERDGTTFARVSIEDLNKARLKKWAGLKAAEQIWIKTNRYDFKPVRGSYLHVKRAAVIDFRDQPEQGFDQAVLIRGGWIGSKKSEAVIYAKNSEAKPIPIPSEMAIAYRDQISPKQEEILGKPGVLQADHPVFYLMEDDQLVFFGHTAMMRLPYRHSPRDLVPADLRNQDQIDLAEAIFGYVRHGRATNDQARAGRVFVLDGTLHDDQPEYWQSLNPRILGGPKPTTFQHYLVQNQESEKSLASYDDPDGTTQIRGHKLYWHKPGTGRADIEQLNRQAVAKATKQYTIIRPLASGVSFTFQIRFENLSDIELGVLLWVLSLGDGDTRLKLGMGKPLGMGSVRVVVNQLLLSNRTTRYTQLFGEAGGWASGDQPASSEQRAAFISAFQQYVLKELELSSGSFDQLARIAQLKAMLSWESAPPRDQTRYMEIERDLQKGYIPAAERKSGRSTVNEYTRRPVLPDPLDVLGWSQEGLLRSEQRAQATPTPTQPLAPKSAATFEIGQQIGGLKVLFKDEEGNVSISLPGAPDGTIAIIMATDLGGANVSIGQQLRAEIIEIRTLKNGKQLVLLRRISGKKNP
ncbi:MAG: TIGR03986 family CRISPR-associated RAMP protein [Roseiflexaceae bacterium]